MLDQSSQFVHLEVSVKNKELWFITIVYGSPIQALRHTIWNFKRRWSDNNQRPWVVLGNFNAIFY